MNPDFELILDDCIARLKSGQTLEECLAAYPSQSNELKPLLTIAARLQQISAPEERPAAIQVGKERLLTAQGQLVSRPRIVQPLQQILTFFRWILFGAKTRGQKYTLRLAVTMSVVLVVAAVMTLNGSARSLPGDPLYDIKRTWEQTRLLFAINQDVREDLEIEYTHNRFEEMQELIQSHRTGSLDFQARISNMDDEVWTVGTFTVTLDDKTTIDGKPAIGKLVHVQASLLDDGTLKALHIKVIQQTMKINEPTEQVKNTLMPGESAELTDDANMENQYSGGSTITPTMEAENGGEEGQEPSATPQPSYTANPSSTPTHSEHEEATQTPRPSKTPKSTDSSDDGTSTQVHTPTSTSPGDGTPSSTSTPIKEPDD